MAGKGLGTYPDWCYFPRRTLAPEWVTTFISCVHSNREALDSRTHPKLDSNEVLGVLRNDLVTLGWSIEAGKKHIDRIRRPVLFGDRGIARVNYEIDGWHDKENAVLEIESGRGWQGNAFYRNLIRTSLIQGAEYLVIGMRLSYSYAGVSAQNDFEKARDQLDAIYASGRLELPFSGVLLFGW